MSVAPKCSILYVINYIKNWLTQSKYLKIPKFIWSLWTDLIIHTVKCVEHIHFKDYALSMIVNTLCFISSKCQHLSERWMFLPLQQDKYMWNPTITGRQSSLIPHYESRSNKPPAQVMQAIGLHSGMCKIWSRRSVITRVEWHCLESFRLQYEDIIDLLKLTIAADLRN